MSGDIVKNKEGNKSIYPAKKKSVIPHMAYLKRNEWINTFLCEQQSLEILSKCPPYLIKTTAVLTSGSHSQQS